MASRDLLARLLAANPLADLHVHPVTHPACPPRPLAPQRVESAVMRRLVLEEGYRADGRSIGDVRPIWSRAGLLPRTHGSVLFTRGETQVGAVMGCAGLCCTGLCWAGLFCAGLGCAGLGRAGLYLVVLCCAVLCLLRS